MFGVSSARQPTRPEARDAFPLAGEESGADWDYKPSDDLIAALRLGKAHKMSRLHVIRLLRDLSFAAAVLNLTLHDAAGSTALFARRFGST